MKKLARPFLAAVILTALPSPASAQRFVNGQAADAVLGQTDFLSTTNAPTLPNRLSGPWGVALDPITGKVFVADAGNHRVLRFPGAAAAQIGAFPEAVFGQVTFSGSDPNQVGPAAANTLHSPRGLAVDSLGRLWIADSQNHRVLMFQAASFVGPTNPTADLVLGQPDFTTATFGVGPAKMNLPIDVSAGPADVLWVSELNNRRVLRYDNVTAAVLGTPADIVLGQPDFGTTSSAVTAQKFASGGGIFADSAGRLWVADATGHRILRFDSASSKLSGAAADAVVGQAAFTASASGVSATLFQFPLDVLLDNAGALWVADSSNNRLVRFPTAAAIATGGTADLVLGQRNFDVGLALPTSATSVNSPTLLAAGPGGSVLVGDSNFNRVLRFRPVPAATLAVTGPRRFSTPRARLTLRGTATTATSVRLKVGRRPFRSAALAGENWTFPARLRAGLNRVQVQAFGPGGDAAPVTLRIHRLVR